MQGFCKEPFFLACIPIAAAIRIPVPHAVGENTKKGSLQNVHSAENPFIDFIDSLLSAEHADDAHHLFFGAGAAADAVHV
ncbi:MAG: hypothetical protein MJ074_09455, partial [Oscillospiraceae bacterium]|nr:hypothetical protein [Oscillospiraceae bacterium]